MTQVARLFINGRSQAVRLPAAFRFDTKEVFVSQDPATGDVILSRKPNDWEGFVTVLNDAGVGDFLGSDERRQGEDERDPFEGWRE